MPESYARALALAVQLVQEAGALLRKEFHRPGGPRGARGHAPVDEAVEARVRRRLLAAFPDWGYRGEETRPHLLGRDVDSHVWLVDPNDGTADFLRGQRGSAVSIGLLRRGEPVLGVVYAPCAPDDDGDLFAWAEGCGPLRRNGHAITSPDWPEALDGHAVALLSSGADRRAVENLRVVAPGRFRALPSIAYRLALAAAGEGAVAGSLHTPGAWDYGGGHALVHGAGGVFLDETGAPVHYALDGASGVQRCFGGAPAVARALLHRAWEQVFQGAPPPYPDPALPFDFLRLRPGQNVDDAGLLARAQGCLLGQVAGDALGALAAAEGPAPVGFTGPRILADGGPYGVMAGQPTGASELALLLARSLVHEGRYDADAAARAYGWWYHTDPLALEAATVRALRAIPEWSAPSSKAEQARIPRAAAAGAAHAAADPASRGVGSLARVSPLGIRGYNLPTDMLAAWARADSALTHPRPACADACAALVAAIAHAVRVGAEPGAAYEAAVAWAEDARAEPAVRAALRAAATAPPTDQGGEEPVLVALQNAFYQLLHAASLEEGVVHAAAQGGEAAPSAAVVGALLGAVYGRRAIPQQWQRTVLSCRPTADPPFAPRPRPRPLWPTDVLVLAERLLVAGGAR